MSGRWDYLVVTASNAAQAAAYERQLAARRIEGVGKALVGSTPWRVVRSYGQWPG
jgi:hypothetical protein